MIEWWNDGKMNVKNIHVRLLCCQHYQNMFTGDSCGLCIPSDYRMLIITLKFNACNWWIMYFKNWTLNQQPTKWKWKKNHLICLTSSKNGSNWIGRCVLLFRLIILYFYSLKFNFPLNSCSAENVKFIRFSFWLNETYSLRSWFWDFDNNNNNNVFRFHCLWRSFRKGLQF